jgi:alpha-tubulin suppressor-like RCC1 family protein
MSQTKAQLVAPVGVVTASSMTVTGVLTATTLDGNVIGAAVSIAQGKNLNVGVITASGIGGDITGSATSITQGNNVTFGSLTASRLVGNLTGNAVGNALGDAVSATVTGITTTNNINVGVITATSFRGSASNLDGVGSSPVSQQAVTIDGAATSIDLSSGNLIYASQSANTTVSFANSENGNVYFVRVKDDTTTARTIAWPASINWDGGTAPTLSNSSSDTEAQIFLLVTRNMGVTWYGKEVFDFMGSGSDLFTWGYDTYGAGATNSRPERSSPAQVGSSGSGWNYLYDGCQGNLTNFYSKLDGSLWSAGYNSRGQLAQNDRITRSSPVQIPGTTWSTSSVVSRFTPVFPKTDGTLWGWGRNSFGELGLNSRLENSSPVQVGSNTNWSSTVGTHNITTALKTDGTLWSWGYNEYGQTGDNSRTNRSSPTQIGTDTTWAKLPISSHEAAGGCGAIKNDGTLWVWARQFFNGQLGLNQTGATSYRSSPTQVGTDTTWSNIATGNKSTMVTKTDGTLWMMGDNEFGALGQNDTVKRSSPVQIPGTNWHLSEFRGIGGEASLAMKQDGTLWTWGTFSSGRRGLNSQVEYSSPVQIPGTWDSIGGGAAVSALKA